MVASVILVTEADEVILAPTEKSVHKVFSVFKVPAVDEDSQDLEVL